MILIIDTTQKECRVSLMDISKTGQNTKEIKWLWQKDTGGEVLENIGKLLRQTGNNINGIQAILVNIGPGSFTGLRIGITISNTLAWSQDIPVLGYQNEISSAEIKKVLSRKHFSRLVLPKYQQ